MSRRTVRAVDVHAAGEPGRVLLDSHLLVRGRDMAERLQFCHDHLQDLRRLVLHEPRGNPAMCGVLVLPPVGDGSDFGVIILEQDGFAPMSGANLMCAVTALLETGSLPAEGPTTSLRVDTAAGTVRVVADLSGGRVTRVSVDNVASFPTALDLRLDLPHYGPVEVDISFGGQFYVHAPAAALGIRLDADHAEEVVRAANVLRCVAQRDVAVRHPLLPGLDRVALPMLHGPSPTPGVDARNAVVLPRGAVSLDDPRTWSRGTLDRSPCGTGTCARMAALHARGQLPAGRPFVHESLLGTTFGGTVRGTTRVGDHEAILPSLTGRAWITGFVDLVVDDEDPFPHGFLLGSHDAGT